MRAKSIAIFLGLCVLGGGCWYVSGPYRATSALRDAADAGDPAKISDHVDFEALRGSIKMDVARAMGDVGRQQAGFLGVVGAALATAVVGPMVDGLVTPESIATMVQGRVPDVRGGTSAPAAAAKVDVSTGWESWDRFLVHVKSPDFPSAEIALVLEPRGLSWKLVGARLPLDAMLRGAGLVSTK